MCESVSGVRPWNFSKGSLLKMEMRGRNKGGRLGAVILLKTD